MSDGWNSGSLRRAFERLAVKLDECAGELNQLDGALGDGDLGVTLVRGVRSVLEDVQDPPEDVGATALLCAKAITKISGSTYGTLLATGLMRLAKAGKGRTQIPWVETSALLGEALEGMKQRGGAALGDKTVLDALEAARSATAGLTEAGEQARAAEAAVARGIEQFRGRPARQGRARIFADKSVGMDDPGMVAFHRIVQALC